jgi:hypothetical protein
MKRPWLFTVVALLWGCGREQIVAAPTQTTSAALPVVAESAPPETEINEPPRHAERVVGQLRPRFRICYERGLAQENHEMSGVVVLHMRVAPDGTVRTVDITKRAGLSNTVATCISRFAQGAVFEAPGAGGAALDVPVHFVRSAVAAH